MKTKIKDQMKTKQEPTHQETSLLWLQSASVTSPQVVHTFVSPQWAQETNVWGKVLAGVRRGPTVTEAITNCYDAMEKM